ncbi:hypothetical protein JCM10207_000040 [Rhodosporidiobolus poonsookiae]
MFPLRLPTLLSLRPLSRPSPSLISRPSPAPFASLLAASPFSSTSAALAQPRKPTKIKLKTHKGAAKRFTALANGEFKRGKTGRVHLNSSGAMSPTRLNRLGQTAYATGAEKRTLRRLMPYA